MSAKETIKRQLKKYAPLYAACRYILHPSILRDDIASLAFQRRLLTSEPVGLSAQADGEEVVVSLTSYGKRLNIVRLAILSMMNQTVMPNRIVLWLDKDTDPSSVPGELKRLESYGLDIRYGCKNLKGHKKYYWALREFEDACVITVDDDVMYPADTIESLMAAHAEFPEAVVGRRVNRLVVNEGKLAPYSDWEFEWHESPLPRKDLLATGVGGVLYPPHCFGEQAFDLSPINGTNLGNDDLWLKANEAIRGRDVAWASCKQIHPYRIIGEQEIALSVANVDGGGNDESIRAIERGLGISFADCAGGSLIRR